MDGLSDRDAYLLERFRSGELTDLQPADLESALGQRAADVMLRANGAGRDGALEGWLAKIAAQEAETFRRALVAVDPTAEAPPAWAAPSRATEAPALPEGARIDPELGKGACRWLDDYAAFSRHWSPNAYEGFHEAVGLWVLSVVAARRVVLHLGSRHYSPLLIALVARTSLWAKSTTADIGMDVLREAGLDFLLAADDATPQKFIHDMAGRVPDVYEELPPVAKETVTRRLAFAGQRGWFYEEFGQQVAAMIRGDGVMADFRGLIRRLDDCKDRYEYGTVSRGSEVIERPYLALLANMTPADMRPLAKRGSTAWNDGFWARFAFIAPPATEPPVGRFPDGERTIPRSLSDPLWKWHQRLGIPTVEIEDGGPNAKKRPALVMPPPPLQCTLGPGVYEAYYAYYESLRQLLAGTTVTDLDGNYARLAAKALRVAMLLAAFDNGGRIELAHWVRAQTITERWRADLHTLFDQVNEAEPSSGQQQEEKVLHVVRKLQTRRAPTAADVSRFLRGMGSAEAKKVLDGLVSAGVLQAVPTPRGATKYRTSGFTLISRDGGSNEP